MTCPGGCIGGGGQPRITTNEVRLARIEAIYKEDEGKQIRKSHLNPEVAKIYEDYLKKPLGEKSHHLLHTKYTPRAPGVGGTGEQRGQGERVGIVATIPEKCKHCYSCVRECPARAIKVIHGQAMVIAELCVACGHCVRLCTQGAKKVEDAVTPVRHLLAGGGSVIACLAPSFPVAFPGIERRQGHLRAAAARLRRGVGGGLRRGAHRPRVRAPGAEGDAGRPPGDLDGLPGHRLVRHQVPAGARRGAGAGGLADGGGGARDQGALRRRTCAWCSSGRASRRRRRCATRRSGASWTPRSPTTSSAPCSRRRRSSRRRNRPRGSTARCATSDGRCPSRAACCGPRGSTPTSSRTACW